MSSLIRSQPANLAILLADDDAIVRNVVERKLQKLGLESLAVDCGQAVLEAFQPQRHRVVLLDWQMPDMDGIEVTRRLKSRSDFVYIIIITGRESAASKLEALESGADAFLAKPISQADLRANLQVGLRLASLHENLQSKLGELEKKNVELNQTIGLLEAAEQARDEQRQHARNLEIKVAARVQQSLLLSNPIRDPCLNVAIWNQPSLEVDGDFVDSFHHSTGVDLMLADVMGKGVQAALLGAAVKNQFLRVLADPERQDSPAHLITSLNRRVAPDLISLSSFVALTYLRFDLAREEVQLVDAGHTKPLLLRGRSGSLLELEGPNVPLGFSPFESYESIRCPMEPGDTLVLYSDGLSEALNPQGELFGVERIRDCFLECARASPQEIVEHLLAAHRQFTADQGRGDDTTLLVMRYQSPPPRPLLCRVQLECPSDLGQLEEIRNLIAEKLEVCWGQLEETWLYELQLAITELVSNVVRHAYLGQRERCLKLLLYVGQQEIWARIYHDGTPCPPENLRQLELSEPQEGGMGLFLVQQVTTDFSSGSHPDGSYHWFEFRKARGGPGHKGD